ncbi:MAG: hypothetical protein JWP96_2730 [Polaromonas sp.]|nr:hypothetical protein [Polaromonas sp.]
MCRALFAIVFFATGIYATSASLPALGHTIAAELKPDAIAALQAKSSPELIKSSTLQHSSTATRIRPIDLSASQPGKDDSGWRYTAALLSTLGLIATIALRRHRAGKR